jgi:thymidylate synthase (FAD)
MKFIEPSVEIIQQESGIDGMMKIIEMAGRTAYKSEDHITEDSAKRFVKMLKDRKHGAALEHGTCYLDIPKEVWNDLVDDHDFNFMDCPYQWFGYSGIKDEYIHLTTNYRVLVEHGYEALLDGMIEPTEEDFARGTFKRRVTVKFICDRGVSHEFCRHRQFSFLMESTRYCNYSKDKFGNELTYIIPRWIHDIQENIASTVDPLTYESREGFRKYQRNTLMDMLCVYDRTVAQYVDTLSNIERCYLDMTTLDDGTKLLPQQARQILPNCLKTELVMTGTIDQWKGFFKLRCAPSAHPDARHLATQL